MPANPRVRTNNVQGTLTDNPLTNVATTMNSAGLANLAAIASQHAVVVLDPLRASGAPEIVVVTAHTGAATSATITRGAYGTSARQHAQGTLWVHAPLTEDFLAIVTSSTRPSDPYRGQLIFETDTDKFVARSTADAWQQVVDLGAWDTWTPVVTQSATPAQSVNRARYTRMGRTVFATFDVSLSGAGTASNPILVTGLPIAAADADDIYGSFHYFDSGNTNRAGTCEGDTTTSVEFYYDGFGNRMGIADFAIATGDRLQGIVIYEAAA